MPDLKVMLAASEIPPPGALRFPLMASYKLDGVRCPMIDGVAYSRKMLPIGNRFFQSWVAKYADVLHGLDGEVIVGKPYQENDEDNVFNRTSGPIGKVSGEPDFTYYVFERWNEVPGTKAWERFMELRESFGPGYSAIPRLQLIAQRLIMNLPQLERMMAEALEIGYEGLILKNPRGLYKNGRSTILEGTLLKWKEFADSECQILGWQQGTTNTNPLMKDALGHAKRSSAKAGKVLTDTLGSWLVRDIYSGVDFKCGPCGTEAEVKAMWAERESYRLKILKYSYQKSGTLRKPRFSQMVCVRELSDLSPDKPPKFLVKES
jgi:DNA ligase-1